MADRIEGKVIVITGASSSGLGAAAARHLAEGERGSFSVPDVPSGSIPWRENYRMRHQARPLLSRLM